MIVLPIISLLLLILIILNAVRIKALEAEIKVLVIENARLKDILWNTPMNGEKEATQLRAAYEANAKKLVGVEARKSRVKGDKA